MPFGVVALSMKNLSHPLLERFELCFLSERIRHRRDRERPASLLEGLSRDLQLGIYIRCCWSGSVMNFRSARGLA